MMEVEWGSESDTGRVRSNNEDSILIRDGVGLAVLCDGMGGHRAGEVASSLAVEVLAASFEASIRPEGGGGQTSGVPASSDRGPESPVGRALFEAAGAANFAVYEKARSSLDCAGMGCTLVALHLDDGRATFVTVGDSRLYLLRGGRLFQISEDHTRLRMLQRMGVSIDSTDARRIRGVLTRAVGTHPDLEVDCGAGQVVDGDLWLLCSDGLTDELDDEMIGSILRGSKGPASAARACAQRAVEAGGRDNVSVIVARVAGGPRAAGQVELPKIETFQFRAGPESF
jgi:PPM family protein phosphatase